MKTLKKLSIAIILLFSIKLQAQTISNHFFGQNAWMPDTIGNASNCIEPPCILYGKLNTQWGNIRDSKASIIRFGGIASDKNMPTDYQYIKMIDSIRANGMEPIIQVPFRNYRYTAQQAADIVKFINITSHKNIKYWIIGNEPDLGYSYTTAGQIAAYIRTFSSAMKVIDPSILIIGPECASFNQTIMSGLTTPNGPDDITGKDSYGNYYIDIISFHTYPFDGSQSRAQVISKLTSPGSLQDNLIYLNTRIANCNSAHNRPAIKLAITEANINWQNNMSDNINGVGANSFIGGQFWAEMIGIAMKNGVDFINFWSVLEGNNTQTDIGYISSQTNIKKSSYYHFQLLAENFKGTYVNGITNQPNVKSFGCQSNGQTCVLILNQDMTNHNYTLKLNTTAIAGSNPLKININAGLNVADYTDIIQGQSSILLVFDVAGNIVKKYEYSIANTLANLPPTLTQYNTTTSVPETHINLDFNIEKLYPNPTNGKFTIQLTNDNPNEVKYEIEVFNMGGQLVLTKSSASFSKGKEEIDLLFTSMADGLYIVRVKQGENMKTAKVILVK